MEAVSGYLIHREKALVRSSKSFDGQKRSSFVHYSENEPGTRYLPSNVREINHHGNGGLMVWAGITLDDYTHLHVFGRGTMIAVKYRNEVLESYAYLFRGAVGRFNFNGWQREATHSFSGRRNSENR
ncbi:uncharacterized protein TNCV_1155621 [Trichonephila clavipes]|nr:uncharacterized protein TNCV_1155621 [Trichonephila clavipes]